MVLSAIISHHHHHNRKKVTQFECTALLFIYSWAVIHSVIQFGSSLCATVLLQRKSFFIWIQSGKSIAIFFFSVFLLPFAFPHVCQLATKLLLLLLFYLFCTFSFLFTLLGRLVLLSFKPFPLFLAPPSPAAAAAVSLLF